MSYGSSYDQYSPYYQQPGWAQDGTYQPNQYQPLSVFQSQSHQSHPQNRSGPPSSHGTQAYENVNPTGNRPTYEARNGYGEESSSVDATILGNLAYSSGLEKEDTLNEQNNIYGSSGSHGLNGAPRATNGHDEEDSGGKQAASIVEPSGTESTTQSQHSGYHLAPSEGSLYPSQARKAIYEISGAAQSHFTTTPPSQRPSQQHTPTQNPDRSYPPARLPQPTVRPQQSRPTNNAQKSQHGNPSYTEIFAQDVAVQNSGNRPSSRTYTQINSQRSQQPTPIQNYQPATVDPSQVFSDFEQQRRKDEGVIKKRSAEAARIAQTVRPGSNPSLEARTSEDPSSQSVYSQPNDVHQVAKAEICSTAEANSAKKDQMELEMKQMIEKMRDYKAKDPSLFSEIWEQVKKGQVTQATPAKPATLDASVSPTVANIQLANPAQLKLPAEYKQPAASSFAPDFDRGRFPYPRRRRGALQSPDVRGLQSQHQGARFPEPLDDIPPAKTPPLIPAPPLAQMTSSGPDRTDQRLYTAMQTFHQSFPIPTPMSNQTREEPRPTPIGNAKQNEPKPPEPTVASAQSINPKCPAGQTHWPEHKKWALAEAARTALTSNPYNIGRHVTAEQIRTVLDRNPSYTQLCEYLEAKGFIIERNHFARFLLGAVPDVAMPPPTLSITNIAPPPPSFPSGHPSSYAPNQRGQNQSGNDFPRISGDEPPRQAHMTVKASEGQYIINQPVTKENKARKRSFADIVDLTQALSDNEDFERHRPKSRMDQSSKSRSLDLAKIMVSRPDTSTPSSGLTKKEGGFGVPFTGRDHVLKEHVVEPINARRKARRCSRYNPQTIARDVLISSGRHPTMAPLNHHLDVLRTRFDEVNFDSDLSTFRWDVVDPSKKPSGKQIAPAMLADVVNQGAAGEDEDDEVVPEPSFELAVRETPNQRGRSRREPRPEAIGKMKASLRDKRIEDSAGMDGFSPPTTTQSTSGVAKKGQEDIKSTRQHLLSLQIPYVKPDVDSHQDGSVMISRFAFSPLTVSKFSLDGSPSKSHSSPLPPAARSNNGRCVRCTRQHRKCDGQRPCSRCQKSGISAEECLIEGESRNLPALVSSTQLVPQSSPFPPALTDPSPKKNVAHGRIRRPPGAKNKQPRSDKGVPKGPRMPSTGTARPMHPPIRAGSTPINSIAVAIPSHSPSMAGGGSQLGTRSVSETGGIVFKSYKCAWENCPAKLHDLNTLRKHVRKHRKGLDRPIPCKWADCGHDIQEDDLQYWLRFNDETAWDRHVEKKHICDAAKTQGNVLSGYSDHDSSD